MPQANIAQNLEQADKKVLKAFTTGANGYQAEYDKVFIIETPERRHERFTIVKTDSGVQEVQDGGAYPTQGINEIGANEIAVRVFKSAIPVTDLADLFDNYGSIAKVAATRGYHFKNKIDQLCADFLNNGTSTSAPYGININGTTYPLFGNSQAIGDTGATQDNRISGSLNKSTLNDARVAMRNMKDHDGMIANYRPTRLVVPPDELQNAWQITQSGMEPESSNNNVNFTKTLGLQLIEWPLLTSTSAAFLLAAKGDMAAKGLRLEVKEMPTMRRIMDTATGNWVYTMRMVLFPGVVDYLGMVSINL